MKRFNFSLQKVLQLRKYREEETRIELGRAIGVLSEIENRIKDTASSHHNAAVQRFSDAGSSAGMAAWEHYIIRLDQEAENLAKEAARAELVVEEKRELYLEASRELKAIEKLKEKREKEHRKEMFAAETAELDTIPGRRRGEE
jgi:flagellar FliJ protein